MSQSPHLNLPYILPSQAQKHVTHNEAVRMLDGLVQLSVLSAQSGIPPQDPAEGDRHIVGVAASGEWSGREGMVAQFIDGAWMFHQPREGWIAFDNGQQAALIFIVTGWTAFSDIVSSGISQFQNLSLAGVNATADPANRLAVSSPSVLFNHEGASQQVKINKANAPDTASLLFQTGFSGRAEIGTAGSEDMAIKVSPDGINWNEAVRIDAANGNVDFPMGLTIGGNAPIGGGHLRAVGSGITAAGLTTTSTSSTQITNVETMAATNANTSLLLTMIFSGLVRSTVGGDDALAFLRPFYVKEGVQIDTFRNHLIGALDTAPQGQASANSFYLCAPATFILTPAMQDNGSWAFGFKGRCHGVGMSLNGFGFSWTAMEYEL